MPGRALIAGCGYVGTALGRLLVERGHEVFGLRRRPEGLPPGIRPLAADLCDAATLRALPDGLDWVFYAASAGGGGPAAYREAYSVGPERLIEALSGRRPGRVLFTSSTGVYASTDGAWIDETSPVDPLDATSRTLLEGERIFAESGIPCVVLRLGGIYGPGRTRLIDRVRAGGSVLRPGPPQYTNRIHRDDAAAALAHLSVLENPEPLYLGVDRDPADEAEVLRFLAARLGVAPPARVVDRGGAEALGAIDPPRRARTNKRCRSDRLVASGYRFLFPTFREGYASVLRAMGLALATLVLVAGGFAAEAEEVGVGGPPPFATTLRSEHPLAGRIFDVGSGKEIRADELAARLAKEDIVLLGERHDHPDHHGLQAWIIARIAEAGRRPAVAFEMLDASQREALDRHLESPGPDADGIAEAVGWEASGWPEFGLYRPIFEAALEAGLAIRAANLARDSAQRLGREGRDALPAELVERLGLDRPLPDAEREAIEAEIIEGHCGHAPRALLPAMVEVQRARDAHMALVLREQARRGPVILVAGNGHVRRDHGVPARLRELGGPKAVSVGIVEVDDSRRDFRSYAFDSSSEGSTPPFDLLWLTPRVDEVDPCERFRDELESLGRKPSAPGAQARDRTP
jgi:uncharacterized iron-regulated protein/nucleoside-diphosphate-sugar epimerase